MKAAVVYTAEGRLNTKTQRQKDFRAITNTFPETYRVNSTKEELCFEYIKSFVDQFSTIQPHRRVPYLTADNEVGTRKFVCTTLRPTSLPIPELYDMFECASFIAGYILYEPLDPPYAPPKYLFSPSQTLDSHCGDSFDMTVLLCSFLLGAGYDAYMVYGYAPKSITLKDQSKTKCPLLSELNSTGSTTRGKKVANINGNDDIVPETDDSGNVKYIPGGPSNEEGKEENSYKPPDNSVKTSQYLADEAEKRRLAGLDPFRLWIPDTDIDERKALAEEEEEENVMDPATIARPSPTSSKGKKGKKGKNIILPQKLRRVHAWVFVRAGNRDVKEDVFIEPSTGRVYSIENAPYLGIEAIWNHTNYWVNTNVELNVAQMNFDLKNNEAAWEQLFIIVNQDNGENKDSNGDGGHIEDGDLMDQHQRANNDDDDAGNANGAAGIQGSSEGRYFDAPPTWASPLALSRSRYLLKYPPLGKRSIQYYCAKADFFAKRSHPQCMVLRIISYLDQACTIVKETHEWFEGRPDKMYKRVRYFLDNRRFVELYHPGSFGEVKRWTEYPGKVIEVDFHVEGRLDRLARREETIGQSVIEHFSGRNDHLTLRSVLLTADRHVVGTRQLPLPSGSGLGTELMVVKMVQEYDPDNSKPEGTDIAKRVFHIAEGKAVFYFHFGKSKITGDVKTYLHARGPSIPVMSEQALAQEVGVDDSQEALLTAGSLERDCYSSIKASFQQYQQLREHRWEVEMQIEYEKNVFEKALDTADAAYGAAGVGRATMESIDTGESAGADYLTPFLRNLPAGAAESGGLSKEDALEIRQACLDALKARLVERANIIQTKLHEENAALGKTQEQFQRAQREGEFDTQKYEDTCTKAMFRIQILEQRLAAHEEAALRKFADLDLKLSMDPRLKVLRN